MRPVLRAATLLAGLGLALSPGGSGERSAARGGGRASRAAITAPHAVTPTTPAAKLPIAGWIIDPDGAPIAGVEITVHDEASTPAPDQHADSDADGAFRVALPATGDRTLLLAGPGVFSSELHWHAGAPPPRIMLARRIEISARVSAGGTPVAGAEVHLSDGSSPTLETALTDRDGVVRFPDLPAGPYELWARRDTAVSPLARTVPDGIAPVEELELALGAGGSVHGEVKGDGSVPAGASLRLVPLDLDHAMRDAALDAAGRFAIDGVPPGKWRLEVGAPGYTPVVTTVTGVTAAATREVVVQLHRAGVVTGTVVDATGAPVADATIVLRGQSASPTAAQAETPVARTPAHLRWVHPLPGPRQMPIRDSRRFGAARPGARPAECGGGHCGVDLGTVRGVVVRAAADGKVALVFTEIRREAGRYVAIDHAGGIRTYYMHLDDIRADLEIGQTVRAGEPIGTVGHTGFLVSGPHLHFAMSQERDGRNFYIDPEPILRHAVVLADPGVLNRSEAHPSLDGAVRATELASAVAGSTAPAVPAAGVPAPRFTTDALGAFRLEDVTPGTYIAAAFASRLAPGASAPFRVRIGEETSGVIITLTPGVIVEGRVLGPAGVVRGARIVADEGLGETSHKVATAFTDDDGNYVLRSLAGRLTLTVTATGYGDLERPIALDEPDRIRGRRREDFELAVEDQQLHGQILDPTGAPVIAEVRIVDGPTRRRHASSDGQGRFALDHLASGSYLVAVIAAGYPTTRATVTTDAWSELRLQQGGSLRLDLRDAHTGAAIAGTRIEATGPGAERGLGVVTGADGLAQLPGLAAGSWTLRAHATGYVAAEQEVEVEPARTPRDVRLELSRGATLAGIVRDRYGQRIAGARVSVGSASTTSDADGQFRLADVPTGDVELEADHDTARATVPLTLAPGDEQVTLTVDLVEP